MIDSDKQIMPIAWMFFQSTYFETCQMKKTLPIYVPKGKLRGDPDYGISAEVILCYLLGFEDTLSLNRKTWDYNARQFKFHNKFIEFYNEVSNEDYFKIYEILFNESRLLFARKELGMLKYGIELRTPNYLDNDFEFELTPEMYLGYFLGVINAKTERLSATAEWELDRFLMKKVGRCFFPNLSEERYLEITSIINMDENIVDFYDMILDVHGIPPMERDDVDPWIDPEHKNFQQNNK